MFQCTSHNNVIWGRPLEDSYLHVVVSLSEVCSHWGVLLVFNSIPVAWHAVPKHMTRFFDVDSITDNTAQ